MIGRSPKLPKLGRPKFKDVGQQRFADALIEWIESRDPAVGRGDRMEALLTRREAVEIGLIRTGGNGNRMVPTAPDVSSVGLGPPVMTVPPAIEGMAADAAIQSIIISWPNQLGIYRNHSFTEIWRAETDDLGEAVLIGQSSGDLYGDAVGPGAGRYYWVRNISTTNIAGPFNGVSGTYAETGLDVPYLLSQIEGEIREDQLFASLATRISLIDASASTTGSVNKRIADTASSLQSGIDLKAAVTYVDTAVATAEGDAIASATQQVWSALGEANAAGVETRATAWNGVSAQWEVKTQVGNLVAGVGLLNDGQKTRLYVQADSFAIYGTSVPWNRADAIPFTVVGGVTYIKNAAIQNASITSAKIQSLAADKIVANDLAAISADLGSITGGSLNINNRFIVTSGGVATIRSATTGARLEMSGDRINVYDSSNNLRVRIGRL